MNEDELAAQIRDLIQDAAPERGRELNEIWATYSPQFAHATDRQGFVIGGGPWGLIPFTRRTMGQVWILGFAGWKALQAYCPHVLCSREIRSSTLGDAPGQAEADAVLEEAVRKVDELREVADVDSYAWPADVPLPGTAPPAAEDDRAVIDIVKIAAAYAFLHELRHVMFASDGNPPEDARDEELECDRFARDFLLKCVGEYSARSGYSAEAVLNKRLIGIALGGYVLLAITPRDRRSMSVTHPPLASRLRQLVQEGDLPPTASLWVFSCCLLLSVLRRDGGLPETLRFVDPPELFRKLLSLV